MWLFSDFQYGFRSSGSTADLLTVVSNRIARALTGLVIMLFLSNPCQPNHSGLLRTTKCSILLNHRITVF